MRQRRFLVGLAALFFAPLGLSFYLYYGHSHFTPGGRVNKGELIDPPRPMPAFAMPLLQAGSTAADLLLNKWTLLYVAGDKCDAVCLEKLYQTRQVRIALDRDMPRVQRLLIAGADCCDREYLRRQQSDLITVRAEGAGPLLAALPSIAGVPPTSAQRVYVIDPLGNLMMSYSPDAPPKGLLTDLKRLLKLSHIG